MKKRILAILACVFMLINVFAFSACDNSELERDIQEVEADNMVELSYWFFTSGVPNNRITLYSSIENAVFECVAYKGNFGKNIKEYTASPNETIYWNYNAADFEEDFVDVALKVEDNYVGYAIIKITQQESIIYTASVLKSAIFPKVEGEYQKVSKMQVDEIIESAKSA